MTEQQQPCPTVLCVCLDNETPRAQGCEGHHPDPRAARLSVLAREGAGCGSVGDVPGQPGEGTSEWSLRGEFWHSVGQVGERQSGVAPPSQFWGQGLPPLAQRPGCRGPSLGWVTGSLFSREPTHQLSMVNGLVPIGLPWVLHNRGLCTIQADPVQLPPWCG